MKIRITFDVDDAERLAVAWYSGQKDMATYAQMKAFLLAEAIDGLEEAVAHREGFWDGERDEADGFPGSAE